MKKLSVDDGEALILSILKRRKERMTTWELDNEVRSADSDCPDEIVRFLARMRQKGLIRGEVSHEKRGWVWWIE
jgi:hypothetical protein